MKDEDLEYKSSIDLKKLPKEYLYLKFRMCINKELYEEKIISFDLFSKMQKFLIKKMDKIISKNIT